MTGVQTCALPIFVRKYCVCMDNAMAKDETKSITEWEKTHPDETAACDKEAGWK